jgi:DNA-binding transcriptional LysR family regulator
MDRDLLPHLGIVLAVARRGGFAAAAAELGMSPSAVSHAVKMVEDRLRGPLFARTTRSVALTQTGEAFVASIGPALAEIQESLERLGAASGRISGLLRLNAPRIALPLAITPVVAALAWRHPDLVVEIVSDDALTDIVAGGFDAGVRLGGMIAKDMIAIRLTPPFKAIMVAAPGYIEAKGEPKTIDDLAAHNCIGFRQPASGGLYAWDLTRGGEDVSVAVKGTMLVTDPSYAKDLALAGVGIAYLFEPLARADIREKRLRWILPEAAVEEPGLFLYYPRRAANAPKLRAFIDMARETLAPRPGSFTPPAASPSASRD